MSSDLEQALDEILSGVNALLEQAPTSRGSQPSGVHDHVDVSVASPSQSPSWGWGNDSELLSLLASTASDSRRGNASLAHRLLLRVISSRARPLGPAAGDAAAVTISPLLSECTSELFSVGARLDHSDAVSLFWDFSACPSGAVVKALGRFFPLLCPVQKASSALTQLPRFPERCRVRWLDHFEGKSTSSAQRSQQAALIDQDNPSAELVTVLWLADDAFVPDHWAGVTFREGALCPVLHVESRHRSIS